MEFAKSVIELLNHEIRVQDLLILLAFRWIIGEAIKEGKMIVKEFKKKPKKRI